MERNELIAQDYLSGMTLSAVAEKYGVTRQRIQQIVARKGISRPRITHSPKLRAYDYEAITAYLQDGSPTLSETARHFGCSMSVIRNVVKQAGIPVRRYLKFNEQAVQDVITRYRAGERLVLIGKTYDVSAQYVNTLLRKAGVTPERRASK
jgi:transposase-like protein